MRKVLITMFMTLDGVAEVPQYKDGSNEDPPWTSLMNSIDTLFLGPKVYEAWATYWPAVKNDPSSGSFEKEFSHFADRAEKVVFSKTLKTADWPNSRIVRGDIGEEIARLKSLPGGDMALAGGPRLAQSFLERGLADELHLEVLPSIVGRGKPMFHVDADPDHQGDFVPLGAPGRHDFHLIEARAQKNGAVYLHYRKAQ